MSLNAPSTASFRYQQEKWSSAIATALECLTLEEQNKQKLSLSKNFPEVVNNTKEETFPSDSHDIFMCYRFNVISSILFQYFNQLNSVGSEHFALSK
jgi:hypothetical protein